jgi:glycine hydroxymethyltransferase
MKENHMPLIVELIDEVICDIENEEKIESTRKKVNVMMKEFPLFAY